MDINRLLKPKTVAVVGASEKDGFGGDTCRNILRYTKNLDGIYFVNPKRETIFDRKCYPNLTSIPADIDLVIICTPQKVVNSVIEEAGAKKCGGAVIFASGYGETGDEGKVLQEELVALCTKHDIAMMGPNCAGFGNYCGDVFSFAFLSEERERLGNIGMISQSGQICLSGLDKLGMGFSYIISSGNSAQISTEEYLKFLAKDEYTKVIAAYIEGITNPACFTEALEIAASKKKPVIILKSGKSNKAVALASSHTGSIAGSDAAFTAIMNKYGAIRVDDIQELLGTAQMFSRLTHLPKHNKWATANVSGGEAGVSADIAFLRNLELSDLSDKTKTALGEIVPAYCTPNNPLDLTATLAYVPELFCKALSLLMEDEDVGGIAIAYTITNTIIDQSIPYMIEGIELLKKQGITKPIVWLPFVEHTPNQECLNKLLDLNIPVLSSGLSGISSLKKLENFAQFDHTNIVKKRNIALPSREIIESEALSETDSMALLDKAGIRGIKRSYVATTAEEAVKYACEFGFPSVLKISSAQILHKSDIGGVKLNINSEKDVKTAFNEIIANAQMHCPEATVDGVLVGNMLRKGVEIIIGMNNDVQFGPMIMVGLGGVFVEIFHDVALLPAPVSELEARNMLKSLKGYALLDGYRGEAVCDIEELVKLICEVSEFVAENKDNIKELDLNPVFVYEQGAGVAVVDALIIKSLD